MSDDIKRIGIVIDKWKLSIFKKVLNEAEYTFTQKPGPSKNTITLYIETPENEVNKLNTVVLVANNRAAKSKSKRWS